MPELPDYVVSGMVRNRSTLLRAMDVVTQKAVAAAVKLSATKLNNLRNNKDEDDRSDLDIFCAILAACNLKVVPASYVAVDPDDLDAYKRLAARKCMEDERPSTFGEL